MSRSSAAAIRRPPRIDAPPAQVAEWQTRRSQKPLSSRACGFESRPGHYELERHLAAALAARFAALGNGLVACPEGLREPAAEGAWGLARTAAAEPDHLLRASLRAL